MASGGKLYEVTQVGAASVNDTQKLNDSLVPLILSDSSFMAVAEQLSDEAKPTELAVCQKQDDVLVPAEAAEPRDVALPPALSECEIQKMTERGQRKFCQILHTNPSVQHMLVSESSRALMPQDAAVTFHRLVDMFGGTAISLRSELSKGGTRPGCEALQHLDEVGLWCPVCVPANGCDWLGSCLQLVDVNSEGKCAACASTFAAC